MWCHKLGRHPQLRTNLGAANSARHNGFWLDGISDNVESAMEATSAEQTPVNIKPRLAWVTQLCADFNIPLTASVGDSTSVFNINAVPPLPVQAVRPIASMSSSETFSPPRVLRSSIRAATPSPTKFAALTSSRALQSARRKGQETRSRSRWSRLVHR